MNGERDLEAGLSAPPMVKNNYKPGNKPGPGLSKQKGASSGGDHSEKTVIPMGKSLANSPGKGLGKTGSGKY